MGSSESATGQSDDNYAVFRDCLSSVLLRTTAASDEPGAKTPGRRKRAKSSAKKSEPVTSHLQSDADDLSDFIDYLADTIFAAFPEALQQLDHRSWRESPDLQTQFTLPLVPENLSVLDLPLSVPETLAAYHLISADPSVDSPLPATTEVFLLPVMTSYVETLTRPPPASWASRTDACELCERDWIPLSYHHLIPRFVHEKVVKRGWHRREDLQNVAWLCGACHRFVHQFKTHEELARDYYTVDSLLADEEVRRFAAWVGRLRWKGGAARRRAR
ncbi:hypothetical protein E4U42_005080 [Claviceps africana]|uniref:HNH domain-containing protein n=1 Tax=Claviceps africana TaxID=83212 RepID=A0A8K0NFS1_9HYPO|nr:hypothetical protein E4U42_005080 [Claviceps africana]